MLKISKLADYATVIMRFLAENPSSRYSAAQVSQGTYIAIPTVSKVLKLLNEAELVNSERGVNGGYQLVKMPTEISLADIITAIDGRPAMTECSQEKDTCLRGSVCELRGNWQSINRVIFNVLDHLTLDDMGKPLRFPELGATDNLSASFREIK